MKFSILLFLLIGSIEFIVFASPGKNDGDPHEKKCSEVSQTHHIYSQNQFVFSFPRRNDVFLRQDSGFVEIPILSQPLEQSLISPVSIVPQPVNFSTVESIKVKSIEALPREIILEILRFLPFQNRVSFYRTNKKYLSFLRFEKNFISTGKSFNSIIINFLSTHCPKLENLIIVGLEQIKTDNNFSDFTSFMNALAEKIENKNFFHLRKLVIHSNCHNFSVFKSTDLFKALKSQNLPHLRHLVIFGGKCSKKMTTVILGCWKDEDDFPQESYLETIKPSLKNLLSASNCLASLILRKKLEGLKILNLHDFFNLQIETTDFKKIILFQKFLTFDSLNLTNFINHDLEQNFSEDSYLKKELSSLEE